ncbi:MAG: glycosyl hydrolase family 28-related protein [Verrucomicrobiia bacterium]|jgi:hypothetical protein
MVRRFAVVSVLLLLCRLASARAENPPAIFAVDDEFVGPFASWGDVKRDFGAVGDGKTDDTAALQKTLDALRPPNRKFHVVYLPAGDYRITRTLHLTRERQDESQNIMILGEDPATTVIRWDGPAGGVMFDYGAWYCKVGRLTLDGAGMAGTAVAHGRRFATYNEFCDMVFRDVGFGIEAGAKGGEGIAESAVMRCRFVRCTEAGISLQNFNSLDWFIWFSTFDDCGDGVTNTRGAGNFYVYKSLFHRSKTADIHIGNTGYFSFRDNTSIESRAFLATSLMNACSMLAIQGNTILDPEEVPIQVDNLGPLLLLDNVIKSHAETAVRVRYVAGLVSMGNTFTVQNPIRGQRCPRTVDDRVVEYGSIRAKLPSMPATPPKRDRAVVEMPAGSRAEAIQKAVDTAIKQPGRRTVVHLPAGTCPIDRTLVIPAGNDVQLVGDGVATILQWTGGENGCVLRTPGPARATLRDLTVNGNKTATGLVVENCDQVGARILMDQVNVHGGQEVGLLIDRLQHTDVSVLNFNHADQVLGVKVVGAAATATNDSTSGRAVIFCGSSSNNELSYEVVNGGRLLVRDTWYETGQFPRFLRCEGAGEFTLHGANVATVYREHMPMIDVNDFHGKLSFLNTIFATKDTQVAIHGDGRETKALFIALGNRSDFLVNESPNAKVALVESFRYWLGGRALPVANRGTADDAFLREMLAQTRHEEFRPLDPVAPDATDLRMYRVSVENTRSGIRLSP